jgi:hypothetical protein
MDYNMGVTKTVLNKKKPQMHKNNDNYNSRNKFPVIENKATQIND